MKKAPILLALVMVLSITLSSCKNADMNITPNSSGYQSQDVSPETEHNNEQYDLLIEECKNTFDSVIISEKFRNFGLVETNQEENLRKAGLIFDKDIRIITKDIEIDTNSNMCALNLGNVLNVNHIYIKTFFSDIKEEKVNKNYFLNTQDKLNIFPIKYIPYDSSDFYFPYFYMEYDNRILCGDEFFRQSNYSKFYLKDFPDFKQSTLFNYFTDDFYNALEKEVGTIKDLKLTLLADFNKEDEIPVEYGFYESGLLLLIQSEKGFFVTLMSPAYEVSDSAQGSVKVFIDCLGKLYYTNNTKPQIGKNIWKPEDFAETYLKADEEHKEFIKTYVPPCG